MAQSKLNLPPPLSYARDIPFSFLTWIQKLYARLGEGPLMVRAYTVSTLPDAGDWSDNDTFSSIVYVTDETGGAVIAFSDGTNWRRVTDRAIVS